MTAITQRKIETNGITMNIAEAGEGPLVILCHGFPESWYSWRHQLTALAAAGYHAVAPDMRGYGKTDAPDAIQDYTILHLTGDMVGLCQGLGAETAVIVGHDWGAPVAWYSALFRPDIFRGVVGLSVPFVPRLKHRPTTTMPKDETGQFYQLYFQEPGVAEAEFSRDPRDTIRRVLYSVSGDLLGQIDAPETSFVSLVPHDGGVLTRSRDPEVLPGWLSDEDVQFYADEFARTGFRGGLNWYRNIDRNWELLGAFSGAKVTVPALFVAGEHDLVMKFRGMDRLLPNLKAFVPELRDSVMLPGCGHWTQQERADDVNKALLAFLKSLD